MQLIAFICISQTTIACCGVTPGGDKLAFGDQEDVIIYNSKTKTDFFIRNAKFEAISPDFGFIAPTPTQPELSSVKPELMKMILSYGGMSRGVEPQIIEEVKVAGYKATIIKATDQKAMSEWLKSNNYKTSKSIDEWLQFYIKKGWFFTAFKVDNLNEVAETGTICMKFKTEIPFHPFYVPKDNWGRVTSGTLKVAIVSDFPDTRSQLGDKPSHLKLYRYGYESPVLTQEDRNKIVDLIGCDYDDLPQRAYVKVFPKTQFPTPEKEDIYFFPDTPNSLLDVLFAPFYELFKPTYHYLNAFKTESKT